ncbi:Archaeal Holliday junction resolvase [uncultured Mediterranean phage uvMED]|nr:Archaeal Holliday junction resolvase [uncultured Mediterranean phage uvMED]BAR22592.1 VRR-NUC domain protein [uncultured Mediterranean phage uvMED]
MSEAKIQAEIVKWFWNGYPEFRGLLYHNFNNPRNKVQGAHLVALGLMKGNPDLTLAIPRGKFGALYLELKKAGEKPRADQFKQMERLEKAGNCVAWVDSTDQAKELIEKYLYLDK